VVSRKRACCNNPHRNHRHRPSADQGDYFIQLERRALRPRRAALAGRGTERCDLTVLWIKRGWILTNGKQRVDRNERQIQRCYSFADRMVACIRGRSRNRLTLPAPLDSGDVAECFDRRDRVRRRLCARDLGDCHVSQGGHACGNE
jgi:hypothetical protein